MCSLVSFSLCLSLSLQLDALNQDKFYCDECRTGRHSCFVCGIEGRDGRDVSKCSLNKCGKYYHWTCLQDYIYRVPSRRRQAAPEPAKEAAAAKSPGGKSPARAASRRLSAGAAAAAVAEEEEDAGVPRFRCPRHFCETCNGEYEGETCHQEMFSCVK
jgi:hypothetical protein